jgi:hypothetical protein
MRTTIHGMLAAALTLVLSGCSSEGSTSPHNAEEAQSWWAWHTEKQDVSRAVLEAINEPGGGDYAKAVDVVHRSSRPPAVKQYEIGQLIVGGIMENAKKRPAETLEQGLRMIEDSTVAKGQKSLGVAQRLRLLFERGDGKPPHTFPKDAAVAACWLGVEEERSNDPARCIALRRQRLPSIK